MNKVCFAVALVITCVGILSVIKIDKEHQQISAELHGEVAATQVELRTTQRKLFETEVELMRIQKSHETIKDSVPSMLATIRDLRAELKDCWEESVAKHFDEEEVN